MRDSRDEINAELGQLLLAPELKECGNHQPDGQREDRAEHRQSRARQSTDDQARRDVGAERNPESHLGESLVE